MLFKIEVSLEGIGYEILIVEFILYYNNID